ncbi:hypothetical protein IB227_16575 [Stenotrophomonas sp. STM01]|uniref:hypothetical protein n=1 Tax=Stenotrophomonas sp. STM01 TaxID=2769278 RepID=UPI00177AC0F6|nr:hypothetical protein [Stenotrophomonas sp. STM01]MBD9537466.1 hypothetical protein [Stenotrophomonas sp. STM01]
MRLHGPVVLATLLALPALHANAAAPAPATSHLHAHSPFAHPLNDEADAPLVSTGGDGRLRYGRYRVRDGAAAEHIVPDFSRAGYRGGGIALPAREALPVRVVLSPAQGEDDQPRIQQAIDAVSALPPDANGVRGVVLLKQGHYTLAQGLRIRAGGVVLRGEGRAADGTVLRSTYSGPQGRIIEVGNRETAVPQPAARPAMTRITAERVPVGAMYLSLASTQGYRVGDSIALMRTPNEAWLGSQGIDTARYGWAAADYVMHYERVVTAVDAGGLQLDAPVVDAIEQRFGGGSVYRTDIARIGEVGIEDLRLEGNPQTGTAVGTPDTGPYTAIRFGGVRDGWVRNVTLRYVSHGITAHNGAHFNTFQDLAYLDPRYGQTQGVRRYVYDYEGNAAFNLTQRCYAEQGRHSFVTGARVPGPNVFLDCLAVDGSNDSGPHHRWATGTLYDNTRDRQLRVQHRRGSGTGHGWPGAQQMFWNTDSARYVLQAPPHAMNWSVGQIGERVPGKFPPEEPTGIVQSPHAVVTPRSLYLQQLHDRLGEQAVINVTTPAQRQGRLWDELAARRGE